MEILNTLSTPLSFILTLMVFGYLLGDIPLLRIAYRLAVYLFVGLAAAFTTIATMNSIVLPLWFGGNDGDRVIFLLALLLTVLLFLQRYPALVWLSNLALAIIIAVGAAVALVGAVTGTIVPLVTSTALSANDGILSAVVMFVGVSTSLAYFQYMARRRADGAIERGRVSQLMSIIGKGFIVLTLGAVYGAAILTSLTIFSERIAALFGFVGG